MTQENSPDRLPHDLIRSGMCRKCHHGKFHCSYINSTIYKGLCWCLNSTTAFVVVNLQRLYFKVGVSKILKELEIKLNILVKYLKGKLIKVLGCSSVKKKFYISLTQ